MNQMPSVPCFNFRFTPSWLMLFVTALFVALFIRLGLWQLQRADEKEKMLQAQTAQLRKSPIDWEAGASFPKQYQKIKVQGHYLDEVFLLDNQHHQHQFGYNVLSPLVLATGQIMLVDRGFVLGDPQRRHFPQIKSPKETISLSGTAYFPSKNPWLLGELSEKKEGNLTIIEAIDVKLLGKILQKEVVPFIMRLDQEEPYGYLRLWAIVSMPPARHKAYALQWFAMALVIVIIFVALNLKKKDEEKKL